MRLRRCSVRLMLKQPIALEALFLYGSLHGTWLKELGPKKCNLYTIQSCIKRHRGKSEKWWLFLCSYLNNIWYSMLRRLLWTNGICRPCSRQNWERRERKHNQSEDFTRIPGKGGWVSELGLCRWDRAWGIQNIMETVARIWIMTNMEVQGEATLHVRCEECCALRLSA